MRITDTASLGQAVREERLKQGLTQAELAGLSGVGITYLSKLENGKATSELGKALGVIATLGLNVYLQRREDEFAAGLRS